MVKQDATVLLVEDIPSPTSPILKLLTIALQSSAHIHPLTPAQIQEKLEEVLVSTPPDVEPRVGILINLDESKKEAAGLALALSAVRPSLPILVLTNHAVSQLTERLTNHQNIAYIPRQEADISLLRTAIASGFRYEKLARELKRETARREQIESLLNIERDVAVSLNSSDDLTLALSKLLQAILRIDGVDCGGVYLADPVSGALNLVTHINLPPAFTESASYFGSDTPQAQLIGRGHPIYKQYSEVLPESKDEIRRQEALRGIAILPILHQGKVEAALNVASHTHNAIPVKARNALEAIAAHIGSAVSALRAKASLVQNERNLQTLFDTMDDFLFILDEQGNILHHNPIVEQRLGYTSAELCHTHVLDLHPPARQSEAVQILNDMVARKVDRCAIPLVTKDGTKIDVETRVTRGRWHGREALFGISRDVTELRERQQFLNVLHNVTRAALEASDLRSMLQTLAHQLKALFHADNCYLTLWDETNRKTIPMAATGELQSRYHLIQIQPDEPTVTKSLLDTGRSLVVEDVHHTPYLSQAIANQFPTHSLLGLPLIADGRKLGAALIAYRDYHQFTLTELTHGEMVAEQISLAVAKAQLLDEVRQRLRETEMLREAALAMSTTLERHSVIEQILVHLQSVVPYDTASIQVLEGKRLKIIGGHGFPNLPEVIGLTFEIDGDNPNREVFRRQEPFIVTDGPALYGDFRKGPHAPAGIRAWLGVPMWAGDRIVGMITLDKTTPDFYTPDHARLAEAFASQAATALDNARLFEQAQNEIAERVAAEAALRDSEELYRSLIEQSRNAIFLIYDGRFVLVNLKGQELFGLTSEEITAPDFNFLNYVAPQHRRRLEERIKSRAGQDDLDSRFEFTALGKDGKEIDLEISISYVAYQDGIAIQGVMADVTERNQMQRKIRHQERLAALGQLSAGIAHDFRNLLATIILYAEMDLHRPDLPPNLAQHLRIISDESHAASDLVQQILDFSSNAMLKAEQLDLVSHTRKVLDTLRHAIPEDITISLSTQAAKCTIYADKGRIQQAITNLVLNARDAMPDGGELQVTIAHMAIHPSTSVPVAGMAPGRWVCLEIADSGTGMTEEVQKHLYEPFFTTKGLDKGTGLGLAQVYGIVRQHHGAIDAHSTLGIGTTFKLYFPVHGNHTGAAGLNRTTPDGNTTIFLVDADPQRLAKGRRTLTALGHEVICAANGHEALALYQSPRWSATKRQRIVLAIAALPLADIAHATLVREFRALNHSLPIVALVTDAISVEEHQGLIRVGFSDVVSSYTDCGTTIRTLARQRASLPR